MEENKNLENLESEEINPNTDEKVIENKIQ